MAILDDALTASVTTALNAIPDPLSGKALGDAGVVTAVSQNAGSITVSLAFSAALCPHKSAVEQAVVTAARGVAGVKDVHLDARVEVVARPSLASNPRLPGIKNIIAVAAGKGGVGKSTVTTNLAAALRAQGHKVGIMDADVYGPSIPQMMGDPEVFSGTNVGDKITPAVHHGVKVISVGFFIERGGAVIWRGPMIHKLLQQFTEDIEWGELDYLLVDLPPGTGDTQLSLSQLIPITGAVMVTTPQEVSIIDVEKAFAMWKRVEVPILGVIENMSHYVCPACGHVDDIFSRGGGRALAEREAATFLGEVPIDTAVRGGGDAGTPVVLAAPTSKPARVFRQIAGDVAAKLAILNSPAPGAGVRSSKLVIR